MRVGGSNLRMRFPGARARRAGRPGPPGDALRPRRPPSTCCFSSRTVSADEALRLGLVNRVAPAAATEEAALSLAGEVAAHPPEAVAMLKRMLHEWDDVEGRSAREGEGQVEWQRSGPGLPYSSD